MKVIKIFGGTITALLAGLAITFVAARFNDGPIGMIPGGPLTSGEMVEYFMTGWERARDVETIELQLAGEDSSRTTWIVTNRSKGYIPASLGFPPGKTWHLRADKNGRAIIRLLGKRYDVNLSRISDLEIEADLVERLGEKYGGGPPSDAGIWFFQITSAVPMPFSRLQPETANRISLLAVRQRLPSR